MTTAISRYESSPYENELGCGSIAMSEAKSSTSRRRWLWELVFLMSVVFAVRAYQQRKLPSGPAPALSGIALDGARVSLDDYRGRPVLLHFWATWCGVCRAEQSSIDALAADAAVLSVASQSGTVAEVADYVRVHGVKPRVIPDASGALAKRFGVSLFPTTFVLDGDGEIRHVEVGYTTELGLRARMWLAGSL